MSVEVGQQCFAMSVIRLIRVVTEQRNSALLGDTFQINLLCPHARYIPDLPELRDISSEFTKRNFPEMKTMAGRRGLQKKQETLRPRLAKLNSPLYNLIAVQTDRQCKLLLKFPTYTN